MCGIWLSYNYKASTTRPVRTLVRKSAPWTCQSTCLLSQVWNLTMTGNGFVCGRKKTGITRFKLVLFCQWALDKPGVGGGGGRKLHCLTISTFESILAIAPRFPIPFILGVVYRSFCSLCACCYHHEAVRHHVMIFSGRSLLADAPVTFFSAFLSYFL